MVFLNSENKLMTEEKVFGSVTIMILLFFELGGITAKKSLCNLIIRFQKFEHFQRTARKYRTD